MDVEEIREKARKEEFILSYHAHEERQAESISLEDIKAALIRRKVN